MRAYIITIKLPVVDAQAADDQAIEIAERVAAELGARRITVHELNVRTGETNPIYAEAA